MNDFYGGISPNAKVRILTSEKKVVHRRLSSLKPGEKLGQAGSRYYCAVNEVRIWKRRLRGYEITLESGEKLVMAENTITCGQFGPNLVQETEGELLCFVIMNSSVASSDSRRTFAVEFVGGDKHKKLIARFCRGASQNKKQFYRFSEVLKFLSKLTDAHPSARIVPCLEVSAHYKGNLYDFATSVKPYMPFLPLIQMQNLGTGLRPPQITPIVLAFCDRDEHVTTRKVTSCKSVSLDGPWAFPIFDRDPDDATSTQQRFSWTANGVPIFNAGSLYVNDWAAERTIAKEGQDVLPPMPPAQDFRFYGVGNSYETLLEHLQPSIEGAVNVQAKLDTLWAALFDLAQAGVAKSDISKHLVAKIKDTVENAAAL